MNLKVLQITNKIEILTLMVYQVSRKAVSFLEIWSAESKEIITRDHTGKNYMMI